MQNKASRWQLHKPLEGGIIIPLEEQQKRRQQMDFQVWT